MFSGGTPQPRAAPYQLCACFISLTDDQTWREELLPALSNHESKMSTVCILAPVVIATWPAFSATVLAAAAALGYTTTEATVTDNLGENVKRANAVDLEVNNSDIVTGTLDRDQRISVSRDGITVTFSRDERGKASVCVTSEIHSKEEMQAAGETLVARVVQQYVYERLMQEVNARGYTVVEEEREANQSIRLRISHWDN